MAEEHSGPSAIIPRRSSDSGRVITWWPKVKNAAGGKIRSAVAQISIHCLKRRTTHQVIAELICFKTVIKQTFYFFKRCNI